MTTLNPYVSFQGQAREALEFYQSVLGGELQISTFENFRDQVSEDELQLVMHGQLDTPDGMTLMVSDTPSSMPYAKPAGISISISGDDEARLVEAWDGLVAGGSVTVPFETPPWGGRFGMLIDKFGIEWMVALNAA